jgi:hypothetical protein
MKRFLILALSVAALSTSAFAQDKKADKKPEKKPAGSPAGRSMKPSKELMLKDSYADSTEFKKAFDELYAIIKPEESVMQKTDRIFLQQSRTFERAGIDSAKAYDLVVKAVDPKMDREIIYTTYRALLTAEELKGFVAFAKTQPGKKFLEVGNRLLGAADTKIDQTIRKTISNTIAPLRQPVKKASKPNGEGEMLKGDLD